MRRTENLAPENLLGAYAAGYFPMAESKTGPIAWYSPDPRCIIPLEGFCAPRSLRRVIRRNVFSITVNLDFQRVIASCADRAETWISREIVKAYTMLHDLGFAHSVEAWSGDRLAGGLYGVALGAAFFGESMFSAEADASKACLVHLVRILRDRGFMLLDSQIMNEHIRRFGAIEIPREEYLFRLRMALDRETRFP
jgi:leucyl/phenylalanyl-tRNA--protein transferase